jgi:multidrug efflux pump subunit AcrB
MSKFFIRRPIVAIVIAILTVIIGVVTLLTLPTSQYPDIVPPEILVTATYPGADAKTVAQAVSTPIEQQMNGVDNMIYMDSVSANNGVVQLFVDFDVKTDPNIDQVLGSASCRSGAISASCAGDHRRTHRAEGAYLAANAGSNQFPWRQAEPGLSY